MFAQSPPEPVEQIIVVTSRDWDSQRGVLRRFELVEGRWTRAGRSARAWLGVNGFAPQRVRKQNSGQTPAGVFTLPQAFGAGPPKRVRLPYHQITARSYWPYDPRDPRTYNVLQTDRAGKARWRADGQWSERLIDYGDQYRFAVVIGYNLPGEVHRHRSGERRAVDPARIHKGGGIFLHVHRDRPTAGCVAVGRKQMRRTLTWVDPQSNPRIVMGPKSLTRGWRSSL